MNRSFVLLISALVIGTLVTAGVWLALLYADRMESHEGATMFIERVPADQGAGAPEITEADLSALLVHVKAAMLDVINGTQDRTSVTLTEVDQASTWDVLDGIALAAGKTQEHYGGPYLLRGGHLKIIEHSP